MAAQIIVINIINIINDFILINNGSNIKTAILRRGESLFCGEKYWDYLLFHTRDQTAFFSVLHAALYFLWLRLWTPEMQWREAWITCARARSGILVRRSSWAANQNIRATRTCLSQPMSTHHPLLGQSQPSFDTQNLGYYEFDLCH